MSEPIDELKNRLKKAIEIRDIKQIDLAAMTGLSRSAINQYLSGYTLPKTDRIHKLAKALNVSEAWLMGFDAPMEREEYITQALIHSYVERDMMDAFLKEEYAHELMSGFMQLSQEQKDYLMQTIRMQLLINLKQP